MTFAYRLQNAIFVATVALSAACGDSDPTGGSAAGGSATGAGTQGGADAGGGEPGGGEPAGGAGACVDVKGFSELAGAFSKCTNCHSTELVTPTERMAAPLGYDYNTYEAATMHLPETRDAIDGGDHPSAPDPQLTPQELADLLAWIDCGGPE